MALSFRQLSAGQKAYFPSNQEAVGLLEGITSVEKALAVPYVRIWQVKPGNGMPVHPDSTGVAPRYPLSIRMVEPPKFGATADVQFRERPPVSLNRVSVKTNSVRGAFTNQTIEMSWTVHRPDVIFGDSDPTRDSWSTLITPGLMHVLEYGWQSSGRHPLLNGDGYHSDAGGRRLTIPAKKRIVFTVIDYSFKISPDMQFEIVTQAVENGDLHLRTATLAGLTLPADDEIQQEERDKDNRVKIARPIVFNQKEAKGIFGQLQNRLRQLKRASRITGVGDTVSFQEFSDRFFAPVLQVALQQMGFKTINLWMGTFNQRAGKTVKRFGAKTLDGASIGDFEVPVDWLQEKFREIVQTGASISVTNFVTVFTHLMQSDEVWDRSESRVDRFGVENYTMPDVRVRTIANGDTIDFFVTDVRDEVTRFTESDRVKGGERLTTDQIRQKLKDKNVPYIRMLKANSFITGCNFNVVNDEQLKAILIKRYNAPTREEFHSQPTADRRKGVVEPSQLIYSSAIVGDIEMIGNFCFDTFAMVWIDFGVPNWNGTFFVNQHEDLIERGTFRTIVSLQATGEDPLNTQGRASP
jgi:hypothetical protein